MTAHLDFALALYEELSERAPATGNLVWSPYSVAAALGITATGARGRTYDELAQALGGDVAGLGRRLADAARVDGAEMAVANTLWTRLGVTADDDYQRAVVGWPGGALHAADFGADPEGSRVKINADVAKTTRGLIKELLAQGTITADTAAVVVNALYLKAAWLKRFGEHATRPRRFRAPSGKRDVPSMHQRERMPYAATRGWSMVTLPTTASDAREATDGTPGDSTRRAGAASNQQGQVVADVLLPDGELTHPDAATLAGLYDSAATAEVDLILPRFRVDTSARLNDPLRALGIGTAFDGEHADFSGITRDQRIYIDQVVHQAVLDVDEQGFEGAAATAVAFALAAALPPSRPVTFHVDRPFLVLVRHQPTGAIYFFARVTEP
jgi:serpin B